MKPHLGILGNRQWLVVCLLSVFIWGVALPERGTVAFGEDRVFSKDRETALDEESRATPKKTPTDDIPRHKGEFDLDAVGRIAESVGELTGSIAEIVERALDDAQQGLDAGLQTLEQQREQTNREVEREPRWTEQTQRQLDQLKLDKTARQRVEVAIAGDMKGAVQEAVAGYRTRANILLMSFVALALSAGLITTTMVSRQRAAEARAALARSEVERERLGKEMTEAQLARMQAQIEPHFLFNTLASVQHLIETDPSKASELQRTLIQYLRGAIPRIRESTTTLGRELDLTRLYLSILKTRMEDRLAFTIEMSPALTDLPFPSMMLMTLVENAVKHGIEPKPEGGSICIHAEQMNDTVRVTVSDTGKGFSLTPGTGVGLANVRERLSLLYGDKAGLVLESNTPCGTRASINIPYVCSTALA